MGSKGSSSKKKSSKKKNTKISSSQILKKKSRRKESKKRHRPHDSDGDSFRSDRTSSSTSISDHRSKKIKSKKLHRRDHSVSSNSDDQKSTSLSPIALKRKKKRTRKRSINPDNDSDSRKRKRSSRDRVLKTRKKSLKKKSKKHMTSSSSSDSDASLSESSFSGDDGKRKRKRVILDREKAHKKRKLRSPSYASSDHEISFNHSDEALIAVNSSHNNSRRLRSVIVIADQTLEETEIILAAKDPNKEEEIVYDRDDYPSPKSFDESDEGPIEKESYYHSQGGYGKKFFEENVNEPTKKSEGEKETIALDGDDLESILRRKALENLKKFRGGIQTGSKIDKVNVKIQDFKEPSTLSGPAFEKDLDVENSKRGESVIAKQTLPLEGADVNSEREKYSPAPVVLTKPAGSGSDNTNRDTAVSEENSLKEQQNETNDSSEFEKKTMSVMRGGEMVQVSYKVYIPKKAPALARRQLRR